MFCGIPQWNHHVLDCFVESFYFLFFTDPVSLLGKIEGKMRRGWQKMRWLDSITDSADMNLSKLQQIVEEDREAWHAAIHEVTKSRTQLSNWNELNWCIKIHFALQQKHILNQLYSNKNFKKIIKIIFYHVSISCSSFSITLWFWEFSV